jgi:hypothetical protein
LQTFDRTKKFVRTTLCALTLALCAETAIAGGSAEIGFDKNRHFMDVKYYSPIISESPNEFIFIRNIVSVDYEGRTQPFTLLDLGKKIIGTKTIGTISTLVETQYSANGLLIKPGIQGVIDYTPLSVSAAVLFGKRNELNVFVNYSDQLTYFNFELFNGFDRLRHQSISGKANIGIILKPEIIISGYLGGNNTSSTIEIYAGLSLIVRTK